jgi:DNA-binding transcriptional LysR family regulator
MEDRLVKFARIVEAGSFTRAAGLMHISQPALTTAVKKLERELQAELLIRSNHRLTLTAAGTIAYETAQTLITETQNLDTRIREARKRTLSLNLGLIDSLANVLFIGSPYLEELEKDAHVSLTIDNSARLIERVLHSELDVALVAQPAELPPSLTAETVGEEPLVLVSSPRLASQVRSDIASRSITNFMSYNQASRTYQLIMEHFAGQGISLQPAFYSTSPEIMLQLVRAGRGVAVLPYQLVQPYVRNGQLLIIGSKNSPIITRVIIALSRNGRIVPRQTQTLIIRARKELQELHREVTGAIKNTVYL